MVTLTDDTRGRMPKGLILKGLMPLEDNAMVNVVRVIVNETIHWFRNRFQPAIKFFL